VRHNIASFIAYELLWFAVVIGAARGFVWPVVGLAVAFVAWQVAVAPSRRLACRGALVALVLGMLVDGGARAFTWLGYASASIALPPGGAPVWILGLWCAFGVTLAGPFRWIAGRPLIAALLGAIGGPLSYLGAERGWRTVVFLAPAWHGIAWLAVTWAAALAVLALAAAPRAAASVGASSVER